MRLLFPSILSGVVFGISLFAATAADIAFLKESGVYVMQANGANPRRLDHDPRPKFALRWDGKRKRVSYLVAGEHGKGGELAIIVELDIDGNKTMEVAIPHDDGIRFVEDFEWLSNGKARLGGSANPRNCLLYDLDPDTGEISAGQVGKCGTFVRSPDDKHTVELGVIPQTDDEHRFDTVDFDAQGFRNDKRNLYGGGEHDIFIPANPVWSPDSQSVAFLEKRADTGEAAVVFLTLAGAATRVPVPASILDHPAIAWVGSKVVAGEGDDAVQIDSVTKQLTGVTADVSDETSRISRAQQSTQATRSRIDDLVSKMGGREAILLEGGAAK